METANQFTTTVQYRLIILISSESIALSVYDSGNSLISTKKMEFSSPAPDLNEIKQLLSTDSQMNFEQVRIIAETDHFSLIPAAIFRPADASVLLNFGRKPEKAEHLLYSSVVAWDCVNVFSIREAVYAAFSQLFPTTEIEHHISYMLTDKIVPESGNKLYVWVRSKKLDVVVVCDGALMLANSYPYATPEDFCYHTLNVIEQLGLNVDVCRVILLNAEKRADLKEVLGKYVTVS
jgi:hypothetical protein